MDSDWNLSKEDWALLAKCNKCAQQLFPHSRQMADQWSEHAFHRFKTEGITPECLRDRRAPGITQLIANRKTNPTLRRMYRLL